MRALWPALLALGLAMAAPAALALGIGQLGARFGGLGAQGLGTTTVIVGCASPTAPNGVVDLSQCSNAYYVALIF